MKFFLLIALFISSTVFAGDIRYSIGGGYMINKADTKGDLGDDVDEELAFTLTLGAKALYQLNESWFLRSGLFFQEKTAKYGLKILGIGSDVKLTSFEIGVPVTAQYQLGRVVGFFGGYVADIPLNSYCEASDGILFTASCDGFSKAKVAHNATLGINIAPTDHFEFDISYQHALTETFDDIKIHAFVSQFYFRF